MGKIFPQLISLKENPSLLGSTLALIEKSFKYQPPFSFQQDFAPLIDASNHHNCFVLVNEEGVVIAHVGVRERKLFLNKREFTIAMLGGIAVDEANRGKGYFNQLMSHVMVEKKDEVAFFLLWSDQEKLYQKFGFHLCGFQYEFEQNNNDSKFEKHKYHLLSANEKKDIQLLYQTSFAQEFTTVERNQTDWDLLKQITSADLYIKKTGSIISDYFFMGKGQDLTGIIYEYGSKTSLESVIKAATGFGKVWASKAYIETENAQYQYLLCPGDSNQLSEFLSEYTNQQINLRTINQMKGEAYFDFNDETLALDTAEFLRGVFGPGSFEELGELKPIFISGLDSI